MAVRQASWAGQAARFLARLSHRALRRPQPPCGYAERVLRAYRAVRPELLPGAQLVIRTSTSGETSFQRCPECRGIDVEAGEWLGGAFRCRSCGMTFGLDADGATILLGEERPTTSLVSHRVAFGDIQRRRS